MPACASWLWQCGGQNRTIKAQQRLASQWLPSHMPSSQGPSLVWMYWMLSNLQCALCQVVIDITYRQACWKAALLALVQMHWMYWMLSNLLQCRVPVPNRAGVGVLVAAKCRQATEGGVQAGRGCGTGPKSFWRLPPENTIRWGLCVKPHPLLLSTKWMSNSQFATSS